MFFIFSKVLDILISPLMWLIGMMLYGILVKRQRKTMLVAALVLLYLLSANGLSLLVFKYYEVEPTPYRDFTRRYDAAIVLGGFTDLEREPQDRVHTNSEADRLLHAIDLYRRGIVKRIILTGGSGSLTPLPGKEGRKAAELLRLLQVPDSVVWMETDSRNTHENAVFTEALLTCENLHKGSFLLVTSAVHMRRSLACFHKVGLTVQPFSTSMRYRPQRGNGLGKLLLPCTDSIARWDMLLHEWVGFISYKILGYC